MAYCAPKGGQSVEQREPAMVSDGAGRPPRPAKTEAEARRFLKRRRDEIGAHRTGAQMFRGPSQERMSFSDLLDAVEHDYQVRQLSSLPQLRSHMKHVRELFAGYAALAVDSTALSGFITDRRAEGASEATIQRGLEIIRRAFSLAAKQRRLTLVPTVPMLNIGNTNARQGFVVRADFEALLAQIGVERGRGNAKRFVPDADLQDFIAWAWWTGMRKSEAGGLTWGAFDRESWTLRLHARDAKTRHGRPLVLEGPLREIIERRLEARRLDCAMIFHRGGQPVREFRKAWTTACKRAGLPGVLFHDLRRSSIRNMIRAGVDPAVAMRISGHRTRAVFDRYNIISEEDLRAAVRRTEEYVSALPKERTTAPIRQARD